MIAEHISNEFLISPPRPTPTPPNLQGYHNLPNFTTLSVAAVFVLQFSVCSFSTVDPTCVEFKF